MTAQHTQQNRTQDPGLTRRVRRDILQRALFNEPLADPAHLKELNEEGQPAVHAHPSIFFPAHFDHAARGVSLPRWRVVLKVFFLLTQWGKAKIVLAGAHPVPYPSVACGGGKANCRFHIRSSLISTKVRESVRIWRGSGSLPQSIGGESGIQVANNSK